MATIDWDNIGITNPLMFATVFRDATLCKELLEPLLGVAIDHIEFVGGEHTMIPEIGSKSIRMDVYVRDGKGTVYDVEMQNVDTKSLTLRSRYYLSCNDMDCLDAGVDYRDMRKSFVIFICKFDPFDDGLPIYTVTPHCKENKKEIDDGTCRLFVNAFAWEKADDGRISSFLHYVADGTIGEDEFTNRVAAAVSSVLRHPDWRREYMRLDQMIKEEKEASYLEGHDECQRRADRSNAQLAAALSEAGRADEALAALADPSLRDALLLEFGITGDEGA